ncbi:ABC transporter permease subunit [Chloroflexi bacterium TSY]|nr:ABC transporter permease subunit [Chloroflexi bacterium TSY]
MYIDWLTPETTALLLQGIYITMGLTIVTSIFSLIIGILFGTLRLSRQKYWRWAAIGFIEIHRNVPALVLIIFWAFAVPNMFPPELRQALFFNNVLMDWLGAVTGLSLPYYALAALLGLTLNTSGYLAELFRAGVSAIAREHIDAAQTLGASNWHLFQTILLPNAIRIAFPAISTRLIHNMKNTALASFVAVPEFFQMTQTAVTRTFRALEFLLLAAAIYLALSIVFAQLLRGVDRRFQKKTAIVT